MYTAATFRALVRLVILGRRPPHLTRLVRLLLCHCWRGGGWQPRHQCRLLVQSIHVCKEVDTKELDPLLAEGQQQTVATCYELKEDWAGELGVSVRA
eukprot:COSAG02_NODE_13_length_57813_cov_14.298276_27_plen_97_part_00